MADYLQLSNEFFQISVDPEGAELRSVLDATEREWLWQGNPEFWAGQAPLLFPFVGRMRDKEYRYQEQVYSAENHGFARHSTFQIQNQSQSSVTLSLEHSEQTLKGYPFPFQLEVTYRLEGTTLQKHHRVYNPSTAPLYYELGGHDGFRLGFFPGDHFSEYQVEIPGLATFSPYEFDENVLLLPPKRSISTPEGRIPLNFGELGLDCYILEDLPQRRANLLDREGRCRLSLSFPDFPFLTLWAPYWKENPPFLCIEPWSSLPDCTFVGPDLVDKIKIRRLEGQQEETLSYETQFFL